MASENDGRETVGSETVGKGELSFEEELGNLERVVNLLERGELSLEESIRQYESGYQSLKRCHEILDQAKKRIEILAGGPGSPSQFQNQDPEEAGGESSGIWRDLESSFPADEKSGSPGPDDAS